MLLNASVMNRERLSRSLLTVVQAMVGAALLSGLAASIYAHGAWPLIIVLAVPLVYPVFRRGSLTASSLEMQRRGLDPQLARARAYWIRAVSSAVIGGSFAGAFWVIASMRALSGFPGNSFMGLALTVIATSAFTLLILVLGYRWFR
jgi:hypothetical protein